MSDISKLISFTEKSANDINTVIKELGILSKKYEKCDVLVELEQLKKEFNSKLEYFTKLYARTKMYKGSNHTYLEDVMKNLKAEAISNLMSPFGKGTSKGLSFSAAEKMLYMDQNFIKKSEDVEKYIKFFIRVEELHKHYQYTLQCIVQSVSVLSKEFNNQKSVN